VTRHVSHGNRIVKKMASQYKKKAPDNQRDAPIKPSPHEFYQVASRRKLYHSLEELQTDLDAWINWYNTERTLDALYPTIVPKPRHEYY
jgi:transposase InsO family protein